MSTVFDKEKELQTNGDYITNGKMYGDPYPVIARLNPPITPRENAIRYYKGLEYEWVPDPFADVMDILPDCIPDTIACGYDGGLDTFGVEWIALDNGLPAFVKPGLILLDDISDWKEVLQFPDVDSWDWEGAAKAYANAVSENRFVRGVVWSGLFERLISVMGFEGASMAMIEDPEETEACMQAFADVNIRIIDHYVDDLHVDGIMMHDDWAAQFSPFFSPALCEEVITPAYKRIVQHAHDRGIIFTSHGCGNAIPLIPQLFEIGSDNWQLQKNALDMRTVLDMCAEKLCVEPEYYFDPEEEEDVLVEKILEQMRENGRYCSYGALDGDGLIESPKLRRAIYTAGRMYANELFNK